MKDHPHLTPSSYIPHYFPLSIFLLLLLSALLSGHYSFRQVQQTLTSDLNQALLHTWQKERELLITPDTIQTYRQLQQGTDRNLLLTLSTPTLKHSLKHRELQDDTYLTFGTLDQNRLPVSTASHRIQSDTLLIEIPEWGETIVLKAFANPSFATVFSLSDQRLSISLILAAFLWLTFSYSFLHRRTPNRTAPADFGGLYFRPEEDLFYCTQGTPIHFTPMQQQLMVLLWNAPSHSMTQEKICAEIWPKKPDASDTLYTLIRRLKPILEEHSQLQLTAEQNRRYTLKIK